MKFWKLILMSLFVTGCSCVCNEHDDLIVAAYVWPSCHDDSLARKWIWPEGIGEWEVIKQGVLLPDRLNGYGYLEAVCGSEKQKEIIHQYVSNYQPKHETVVVLHLLSDAGDAVLCTENYNKRFRSGF